MGWVSVDQSAIALEYSVLHGLKGISRRRRRSLFRGTKLAHLYSEGPSATREGVMCPAASHLVNGYVNAGFESVRDTFVENFTRRHELGGACCVYHNGEKIVD